ncbi:annexin D5-like isoform X2 [Magnolia sinica]|uniref:annexin D5-like isoform X2 n=1 Tax=Magnolia sinica TaxID=86752 RepID=UPI0026582C44|nr:annexin D5-like isoform X2 [Magnolia sinica]XP_058079186.1 annexin D5-like isoform X2 [Magnolia sinica]
MENVMERLKKMENVMATLSNALDEMHTQSIHTKAVKVTCIVPTSEAHSKEERLEKMANVMATLRNALDKMHTQSIHTKDVSATCNVPTSEAPSKEEISAHGAPNPKQDAIHLNSAFKGTGLNLGKVISILANRDTTQRRLIQQEYRLLYSEELNDRLSQELDWNLSWNLGGNINAILKKNVKSAILLWMLDPVERDATIVGKALTLTTLNLDAATEVICSRTPSQVRLFKEAYFKKYGTQLDSDISSRTKGNHKKLLVACVNVARDEETEVDPKMVEEDAKKLFKDGEKTFVRIFSERSWAHLAAVASSYHRTYGNSLEKAVKKETSGHFKHALLTLLGCAMNPAEYFAKVLYKAMEGFGTTDSTLIRVVVTRAEIDMMHIKEEYSKKYKKSLQDAIHSETSGDYRTFLLSLVGPVEP